MVDAGGVVIWLGSAREDLVRGTVQELNALVFLFKERRNHWLKLSYCVA